MFQFGGLENEVLSASRWIGKNSGSLPSGTYVVFSCRCVNERGL